MLQIAEISICVSQDWCVDMNLIRHVMTAEMLKPVTPTVSNEDKTVTEYFPHLVIVQNKAEFTETEPYYLENIEKVFSRVLNKSRLQWRRKNSDNINKPLIVTIPDHDVDRFDEQKNRLKPVQSYETAVDNLRKSVFSLKRTPLTQTKLTEKSWVGLANRTWDNIKNSSFYMEYSKLLP